jgi:hypothetical protein
MARRKKQTLDLGTLFQAVSGNLAEHQADLNQADDYNRNHGDNMVEIFGAINEAIRAKSGKKPAEQLAYASELVAQRSQSGSAKIYASGLSQAARQIKGKSITPDKIPALLEALLGGLASGGLAGQAGANPMGDLLGSLLGGAAGGQGPVAQPSGSAGDLLGSLLGGAAGGQTTASQPGLDMGDLLNAGMAFMNSQQQGESAIQSITKAFVAATQAGQSPHRAQSGELVANTILQMLRNQPAGNR